MPLKENLKMMGEATTVEPSCYNSGFNYNLNLRHRFNTYHDFAQLQTIKCNTVHFYQTYYHELLCIILNTHTANYKH